MTLPVAIAQSFTTMMDKWIVSIMKILLLFSQSQSSLVLTGGSGSMILYIRIRRGIAGIIVITLYP
jgi:hypothetical protein